MAARHQRSLSPSGRFCSSSISSSSSFTASSSSFSSGSSTTSFMHRSSSPTRVHMYGGASPHQTTSSSVRFSTCPSSRPNGVVKKKMTCLCSPTTHPGSFRCNYHKNLEKRQSQIQTTSYSPNRLNMRRSAMTNSLVRIGTVEGGEWVRRALATLIRPSSHQQRRRADFQPKPSRLSLMSKADENN